MSDLYRLLVEKHIIADESKLMEDIASVLWYRTGNRLVSGKGNLAGIAIPDRDAGLRGVVEQGLSLELGGLRNS